MPPPFKALRIAAFILSDVRSGSTLLDQCLGAHASVVALGETHWLRAYARNDRSRYDPVHELVCACGQSLRKCAFWVSVGRELGRSLESLDLHTDTMRFHDLARRVLRVQPSIFRSRLVRFILGATHLARDSTLLVEASARACGRPVVIDSSKSAFRFRAVYARDPKRTRAIVLSRDFRAVIHSKLKRGHSIESAADGWRAAMRQIGLMTSDLPSEHVHLVKFEAFCEEPRTQLARLCGFLGIEFSESMLRRPETGVVHSIGGSPSKFDASRREIQLDRSYENAFSVEDQVKMRAVIGSEAERWGY